MKQQDVAKLKIVGQFQASIAQIAAVKSSLVQ